MSSGCAPIAIAAFSAIYQTGKSCMVASLKSHSEKLCRRPSCSLHASLMAEPSQAPLGSAMFIVTDDPRRPPSSVGAAWLGLCLPRNAWQHPSKDEQMPLLRSLAHRGARVSINMALLTELFPSPPPRSTVLKMHVRYSEDGEDGRTPKFRLPVHNCAE